MPPCLPIKESSSSLYPSFPQASPLGNLLVIRIGVVQDPIPHRRRERDPNERGQLLGVGHRLKAQVFVAKNERPFGILMPAKNIESVGSPLLVFFLLLVRDLFKFQ